MPDCPGSAPPDQPQPLAGVRVEETATEGNGPVNQLTAAERARRTAWGTAPVTDEEAQRRATTEWGGRTHAEGKYRNVFPGLHFTFAPRGGLVARLSYSTSIGRPPVTSIIPNLAVNDEAQTVSMANNALRPQRSDNFDLNVEYYFEPIGLLSASVFLKEVDGFIYSTNRLIVPSGPDNGFEGMYEGYRLTTSLNGGHARYRGFELSYQQQFTFLRGFWRGFGVNANYTQLETKGDYGGTVATTQVAGFRPKSANAAINYQKGKYRSSVQANWVDAYLLTVAANPAQIVYEAPRTSVNVKFTYDYSSRTSFYLNLDNLTRSPINSRYYTYRDRIGYTRLPYRSIAAGVQGRF
ncbi:MAG: outer membrane beta-barrel protein [Opitutaceae bacterium]|nr:outer membrane beta-barrel protein [Opitutaceae bacterium]